VKAGTTCSASEERLTALFAVMSEELGARSTSSPSGLAVIERQQTRMRKRAEYVNKALTGKAVDGFIADNAYVSQRELGVSAQIVRDAAYFILRALENVTTQFDEDEVQNTLSIDLLLDLWRFGPGASNGIRGTHTADKVEQLMTCTPPSESLVAKLRSRNAYFQLFDERHEGRGQLLIQGSRLTTVPKNEDTERTIAIEPSGNMALQLAAGEYLTLGLRAIGVDIRDQQPKNKLLAQSGSIDGGIATIDLKSASNLYGCDLVRLLLPPKWFRLLMQIRSEQIELPSGEQLRLNMISTMGNGFTFPLMTLINCALIYAYRCQRGGPNLFIDWTHTAVFGDDIIVPTHEYTGICELLSSAGLVVNHDKSFCEGPFRESCGGDYFDGVDVTPFYVRRLASNADVYTAINQCLSWCGRTGVLLPSTLRCLKSYLRGPIYLVPEWNSPTSGVMTALVPKRYKYLSPVPLAVKRSSSLFTCMLACGGYIESAGLDFVFTPRQNKTRYVVKKSRLPNGFLDGSDRVSRSEHVTYIVAILVASVFEELVTHVTSR
jgi:hypothetical protein